MYAKIGQKQRLSTYPGHLGRLLHPKYCQQPCYMTEVKLNFKKGSCPDFGQITPSGFVLRPSHFAQVIPPFLHQLNACESIALGHKGLLAGESILQGLRRWSRLPKQCTQAQSPWPAVPRYASSCTPRV